MQYNKLSHQLRVAFLLLLSLVTCSTAFGARSRHYLTAWGQAGYSNFLHSFTDTKAQGSGGVAFGGGYQLRKNAFLFNTGLELSFLNTFNKLENMDFKADMFDTEGDHLIWNGTYLRYKEQQHAGFVQVPILLGAEFKPVYFLIGAKAGINFFGTYNVGGKLNTTGTYDRYYDDFQDMPNHYFTDTKFKQGAKKLEFAMPQVVATAEVGMYLDKYIKSAKKKQANAAAAKQPNNKKTAAKGPAKPMLKNGKPAPKAEPAVEETPALEPQAARVDKFKKEPMHLRVAVFADYGVLNMQNSRMQGYSQDVIATLPKPDDVTITEPEVIGVTSISVNESRRATSAINNLFVGVKATLTFDVTRPPKKKPVPPKPVPNPKPKPVPPVPVLEGQVTDLETGDAVYDPKVEIYDMSGKRVYGSQPAEGDFSTKLDRSKNYRIVVTAPGYYTKVDTVKGVTEPVMLPMSPIKPEPIVMENVFFEFDKTDILPASDVELDRWAEFLKQNPTLIIHITGHTDWMGSDEYNQRLSEGRANSVMQALIDRGIDPARLSASGKGESEPRDTNETDEGRARNRRVEFEVVGILELDEEE